MALFISPELVKKAQDGDRLALEELLVKSEGLIRGTLFHFFHNSEIEDAIQEVKIRIFEELSSLKNPQAYPSWTKWVAQTTGLNLLKKKRPVLLKSADEGEEEHGTQTLFDYRGHKKDSHEESKKAEEDFEFKQRILAVAKSLDLQDFEILKMRYIEECTLEDLALSGSFKKSSYPEKIDIARGHWILQEANRDWEGSNFEEAKNRLKIIIKDFQPDDSSKEKRVILASALTRMGDIHQVLGQIHGPDKSIDFFMRGRKIWDDLRDKTMRSYTQHMIALCNNISEDFSKAIEILNETKDDYPHKSAHGQHLRGSLERDLGAIYLNLNEDKLAKFHIERSLGMLEDAEDRESYLSAIRQLGKLQTKLKQFDEAYVALKDCIKESPPYRALHHLQTKIALVELSFSSGEISQGLLEAKEAEKKAKEYGFLHQLHGLNKILMYYRLAPLNRPLL